LAGRLGRAGPRTDDVLEHGVAAVAEPRAFAPATLRPRNGRLCIASAISWPIIFSPLAKMVPTRAISSEVSSASPTATYRRSSPLTRHARLPRDFVGVDDHCRTRPPDRLGARLL
jgi:hypothetical protein